MRLSLIFILLMFCFQAAIAQTSGVIIGNVRDKNTQLLPFFCSEDASYVNGQIIASDGGESNVYGNV